MLDQPLSPFNKSQANFSPSCANVFELEKQCLVTGQHDSALFPSRNPAADMAKPIRQISSDFLENCAPAAASNRAHRSKNYSACFVRMPESQMKRKAFATQSPFDRGLLLGRGAFLF
jgi:hypothetical protein